jgi:hypothetical protein
MGLKEWAANAPMAMFSDVMLYKNRIKRGHEEFPLAGVSARVELGSALQKRVTMTRLVAIGVFALLAKKKKSGGDVYLTIEAPDFFWTVEVESKKESKAREFAAKVNNAVRSAV